MSVWYYTRMVELFYGGMVLGNYGWMTEWHYGSIALMK